VGGLIGTLKIRGQVEMIVYIPEAGTMTSSGEVELKVKPLSYLSRLDESAFFAWLDKIPCVLSQTPPAKRVA
jgi:hypothetical protein